MGLRWSFWSTRLSLLCIDDSGDNSQERINERLDSLVSSHKALEEDFSVRATPIPRLPDATFRPSDVFRHGPDTDARVLCDLQEEVSCLEMKCPGWYTSDVN